LIVAADVLMKSPGKPGLFCGFRVVDKAVEQRL